jgi:hypothetical protein
MMEATAQLAMQTPSIFIWTIELRPRFQDIQR